MSSVPKLDFEENRHDLQRRNIEQCIIFYLSKLHIFLYYWVIRNYPGKKKNRKSMNFECIIIIINTSVSIFLMGYLNA